MIHQNRSLMIALSSTDMFYCEQMSKKWSTTCICPRGSAIDWLKNAQLIIYMALIIHFMTHQLFGLKAGVYIKATCHALCLSD